MCLTLVPFVWIGIYSAGFENNNSYYVGVVASVILLIRPLIIGTVLFLLWKNPAKYKEYDMKRRRKMRESDSEDK